MPLPVISAATLEKFSLVLNGAPLMITGDQSGTASAANPSGLRLAGGNLFRDYTPWTEQEINDWSQGVGHAKLGDNGFFYSQGINTIYNDIRFQTGFTFPTTNAEGRFVGADVPKPDSTTKPWTTNPYMEHGYVEASDGNLYTFFGFTIYKYTVATDTWSSWFDVRNTVFHANHQALRQSYIIDMCDFNGRLVIVTTPFFRTSEPVGGINPPLDDEFGVNVGATPAVFVAYPNVFAIDLADAEPWAVGTTGQVTLPLQAGDTFTTGVDYPSSGLCATACYSFSGYLFIGGSAGFIYTSGESIGTTPENWHFEGQNLLADTGYYAANTPVRLPSPLNLSTKFGGDRWVTGFAGIQGQTIGETAVYMSTSDALYLLDLAIPTQVRVYDYAGTYVRNGMGMVSHQNDIYIPTQNGVVRFTSSGQTVEVGIDTVPVSPAATPNATPFDHHIDLATSPGALLSIVGDYQPAVTPGFDKTPNSIVALVGQGWHPMQSSREPISLYYMDGLRSIFFTTADSDVYLRAVGAGTLLAFCRIPFSDTEKTMENMILNSDAIYNASTTGGAYIELGWFDAGAPLLTKDWHSISVYGRCFSEDVTAEVMYRVADAPADCAWHTAFFEGVGYTIEGYESLGFISSGNEAEFIIPTTHDECPDTMRTGKFISVIIRLRSNDEEVTPIVESIKLKYFVPIDDYFRFTYSVSLPKNCITDLCGDELAEYDQAEWDEAIRQAACSVEPVPFRDIDGKWYLIRIESESRRIDKVNYIGAPNYREYDITWNLVFIQVMNPSICDESWVASCAT